MSARLWWCRTCGVVWTADVAPLCRHMVIDGPPAARMEKLPSYHPFSGEITSNETGESA